MRRMRTAGLAVERRLTRRAFVIDLVRGFLKFRDDLYREPEILKLVVGHGIFDAESVPPHCAPNGGWNLEFGETLNGLGGVLAQEGVRILIFDGIPPKVHIPHSALRSAVDYLLYSMA